MGAARKPLNEQIFIGNCFFGEIPALSLITSHYGSSEVMLTLSFQHHSSVVRLGGVINPGGAENNPLSSAADRE